MNENRIVRVRNKKWHELLEFASEYCGVTYQFAFEQLCDLMTQGYTFGTHTNVLLVEKIKANKDKK